MAFAPIAAIADESLHLLLNYPVVGPIADWFHADLHSHYEATKASSAVDHNGFVWYNSSDDDIIGRLDPKTGVVVKYPFPHSDNGIRELNTDSDGRIWYTTPFNNKVGYFFPPK